MLTAQITFFTQKINPENNSENKIIQYIQIIQNIKNLQKNKPEKCIHKNKLIELTKK